MNEKKIDWRIICVGIICLAGLEIYALSQGINGTLFTLVAAIIGAAIGVGVPLSGAKQTIKK